jgi:aminoglycoside phosphotransferase family enzyme
MRSRSENTRAVDTQEKVAFLGSPAAYPGGPVEVDVIETHMSWVFLANNSVFKLKKPVKYPFLDFSTVAAREADCRLEVHLNQRLAPGIYLCVVALTLEANATLSLNGTGKVVDWLVKMRRLPADRMLDQAIERCTLIQAEVERVADVLADFYRRAQPADLTPQEYVAQFAHEQAKNASVLTMPIFDLSRETVLTVLKATGDFIAQEPPTLTNRMRDGHVVEGHGDLRPEHICLLDPPVVIDCLEFNRRLRFVDPFDELAFFGLECTRMGAAWIGDLVTERCGRALGDRPSDRLIAFYTTFRASLRARLALAHLLEPNPREPDKWVPRARQYLAIAEQASVRIFPPEAPRSTPHRGNV